MNWWTDRRCAAVTAEREAAAAKAAKPAHWIRPTCPECQGTGGDEGLGCEACWVAFVARADIEPNGEQTI